MVVALAAAGGERVAEPEAALERKPGGDVGKRRGALVRRDHEIGIVAVGAHHVGRRNQFAAGEVVGEVEQAVDQRLVAGDPFGQERARLFALPRSSWADYDAKLISKGGAVFPRSAKTIPLST
ncbi:MAG: NAD-glutamate dehydrogenase, partial [Rhodospirillales bacterium]|nr:NAD-glutamate dehydrogenase [Rhodospirillales bacterium]